MDCLSNFNYKLKTVYLLTVATMILLNYKILLLSHWLEMLNEIGGMFYLKPKNIQNNNVKLVTNLKYIRFKFFIS